MKISPVLSSFLLCLSLFVLQGCSTNTLQSSLSTIDSENTPIEVPPESITDLPIITIIDSVDEVILHLDSSLLDSTSKTYKTSTHQILNQYLIGTDDHRLLVNDDFIAVASVAISSSENFAVLYANKLAHFLLDEEFVCSEPLINQYFRSRYILPDLDNGSEQCHNPIPFSIVSKNDADQVVWLDPARISSVHLLFAGNDEGLISRFGHVQLRLIVCPKDNRSPEACDRNLYEHITIGYRAHVDEFNINTFKGLIGSYKAYLYAERFMDSYRQYAINEFRHLYSVPLHLSKEKRLSFVKALAQVHWSFSGEYKFITRNCSTFLQAFLKVIWPDYSNNEAVMDELYLRPDTFFETMLQQPLTESEVLDDLKQAEELGYFFASTEPIYTKALKQVYTSMSQKDFVDLDSYRVINPYKRYANIIADEVYFDKLKKDGVLLGAQLLIEEYSAIKSRSRMGSALADFFENNNSDIIVQSMHDSLSDHDYRVFSQCILKPIQVLISPKKRINGIPFSRDLVSNETGEFNCSSNNNWASLNNINKQFEILDESRWQPVKVSMFYWLESLNNVLRLMELKSKE